MDAEQPILSNTTWLSSSNHPFSVHSGFFGFELRLLFVLVALLSAPCVRAGESVTLAWDPSAQSNVIGYRLYYGTFSRNYTASNRVDAPATISTAANLVGGRTYYFAVTAIDSDGLESDYSAEVTYVVPGLAPAPDFTQVDVSPGSSPAPPSSLGLFDTEEIVESGFNLVSPIPPPPFASGPRLEIVPFGSPIAAYVVGFDAPAGKACELQTSNDLIVWQRTFYRASQALGERLEFFDFPGAAKTRRYYRVAIW